MIDTKRPKSECGNTAGSGSQPTPAQLLYAHTQTMEMIEDLQRAVRDMPLLDAGDAETFARFIGELDDVSDALDGLAKKFRRNTAI